MPAVMLASTMLLLDRSVSTQFFNLAEGGDVLLYQYLFWFFDHPEVYIIFLPETGIVSTIIPTFSCGPMFGYTAAVLAMVATGFLAFASGSITCTHRRCSLSFIGALYYWMPKFTGWMLNEVAGQWHFWLFFIGFNFTFFPMHLLGLHGMTSRIYTYSPGMEWSELNLLASFASC
jgi:heme/copper-type cytochrome/quinol oxidase subunit 1